MNVSSVFLALILSFLAGISTLIGGIISLHKITYNRSYLAFILGLSAGVMIYISFVELLSDSIINIGFLKANLSFFIGIIFIMSVDMIFPHSHLRENSKDKTKKRLLTTGIITALGIAIHNFPEGIIVFMSSLENLKLGIPLFLAIAIHNIPEGMAIATPIYHATKSKKQALFYSLFSGLAEPLGAILAFLILSPYLTTNLLSEILAFVAGIMVYISLDELLPVCMKNSQGHVSILGIVFGMMLMALSLHPF